MASSPASSEKSPRSPQPTDREHPCLVQTPSSVSPKSPQTPNSYIAKHFSYLKQADSQDTMDSPTGKVNGAFEVIVDDDIRPDNNPSASETDSNATTKVTRTSTKRSSTSNGKRASNCSKNNCRNSGLDALWTTEVPIQTLPTRWNATMRSVEEESDTGNGKCIIICAVTLLVLIVVGCSVAAAVYLLSNKSVPTEANATTASTSAYVFDGSLVLDDKWSDELLDKNSSMYKNISGMLSTKILDILETAYPETKTSVAVQGFQKGSIKSFFRVVFDHVYDVGKVVSTIRKGFTNLVNSGQSFLRIDPKTISILAVPQTTPTEALSTTTPLTIRTQTTTRLSTVPLTVENRVRTTPHAVACYDMGHSYLTKVCRDLGSSWTGYPNMFGMRSREQAASYISVYERLASKGCYKYVLQFACAALFPMCENGRLIQPCRSFCEEFAHKCSFAIRCDGLPDDDHPYMCRQSPDRVGSPVITSQPPNDTTDCSRSEIRCDNNNCVRTTSWCDGVNDCGDFSDELHCGETSVLDCNFDQGTTCSYRQETESDHFQWTVQSAASPSSETGPHWDHTLRNMSGQYLLAEGSGKYYLDIARLISREVTSSQVQCLRFYYYMFGEDVDSLNLYLNDEGMNETLVWQRRRNHGDHWLQGYVTVPSGKARSVTFEAIRGVSFKSDIAVDDITLRNGTCPDQECELDEFMCNNNHCLSTVYKCNGVNDCGDYSDEYNCQCTSEQFRCSFGMCIDDYKRCDGTYDCPDNSDELNCGECRLGQHTCPDGKCIMREWLCDREKDCSDGSDEINCNKCSSWQFVCHDYSCVEPSARCDGVSQCSDDSDEEKCFRQKDSEVVEMFKDGGWWPICAEDFPKDQLTNVCEEIGMGSFVSMKARTKQSDFYLKFTGGDSTKYLSGKLEKRTTCSRDSVITVLCNQKECGTRSSRIPATYIVNGEKATAGRWPWQIGLFVNGVYTCGGSLISRYHVISAAHCASPERKLTAGAFAVKLGSTTKYRDDPHRIKRLVLKVEIHTKYDKYYWGYDLAVFTLASPVEFDDYIRPICLPSADDVFPLTSNCYSSGWGYTFYQNKTAPENLQEAKVKLWANDKCRMSYSYLIDSMVCAGYTSGHIANCVGDSGGPLVCEDPHGHWSLVGVFTFMTIGCNVPARPPVFTRVTSFLPWIARAQACAFTCDNKKCLHLESDMCNGVDDCGDYSDEIRNCAPSISCTFEDTYTCGYTRTSDSRFRAWSRVAGNQRENEGPTFDFTYGNASGHYMFAGDKQSMLVAPLYDLPSNHCLRFRYHMRLVDGTTAGLLMFAKETDDDHATLPPRSINLQKDDRKFSKLGTQGDIWLTGMGDIPAGRYLIGFQAVALRDTVKPAVAIDDVELLEGTCLEQGCSKDQFKCTASGMCAPARERCNYHIYCLDTSDEVCTRRNDYKCDFERYGSCGFEQATEDNKDWDVISSSTYHFNGPTTDHTRQSFAGHFGYFSTLYASVGERAILTLPVSAPGPTIGCLQLYYSMVSNGSLSIQFKSRKEQQEEWAVIRANVPRWKRVQIPMSLNTELVYIVGTAGRDRGLSGKSYIAIDDVFITSRACDEPECRPTQFRCDNGHCVMNDHKCDGLYDCEDRSDEKASLCGVNVCPPDMFRCADGKCLQGHVRCNGITNCADYSDEVGCTGHCSAGEYQCASDNSCKPIITWCDGTNDCADNSDELPNCKCKEEQFTCNNDLCIMGVRYCDGVTDCTDGSDELPGCTCDPRWQLRCENGKCVSKSFRCDRTDNCGDLSDEMNCNCSSTQFRCNNGVCLEGSAYCNGIPDCPEAEDELHCRCTREQFQCRSGGCIHNDFVCDARIDCFDLSDEDTCDCFDSEWKCKNGLCILKEQICDGIKHCTDNSDENNCTSSSSQFRCANGLLIAENKRCDMTDDCGDESDEMGCPCLDHEFRCSDGKCILSLWKCDGTADCVNGTDELGCATVCTGSDWQCGDNTCVSVAGRCDGHAQCADASDELGCVRQNTSSDGTYSGLLQGFRNGRWYHVCADNWSRDWSNTVCSGLGNGRPRMTTSVVLQSAKYLVTHKETTFNIGLATLRNTCPGNKVVRLICADSECGRRSPAIIAAPAPFIVGGELSRDGWWPWVASVKYLGAFRCGAVLVHKQWVMSAAHCFYATNGNSLASLTRYIRIQMGTVKENGVSPHVVSARVNKVFVHREYTNKAAPYRFNDVALIKLEKPVLINDYVKPICLPESSDTMWPSPKDRCYMAGWGFTNVERRTPAVSQREAKMRAWKSSRCGESKFWGGGIQNASQLCAGYESGYIATCFGDSGGPLMCENSVTKRWSLAGVLSFGPSSCGRDRSHPETRTMPGVYSRVTNYLNWLWATIEGHQ